MLRSFDAAVKVIMDKYALVLSGGGARGAYEIGVWQALRELKIPIDIVTGTSVGALNGCLIAQDRFDEAVELWNNVETQMVFDINEDGSGFGLNTGTSGLAEIIRKYADEKAIRNSPVDYGLVMVQLPEMKPHYLFTDQIPEGKLHDFILASSSVYPAFEAVEIDGSKYIDGGYVDVMPVQMAVDRGADHIIAVFLDALGILRKKRLREAEKHTKSLRVIKSDIDLGDVLKFDTNNSKRIMRLGYLDTMKSYDIYDGSKYTFEKNIFPYHQLSGAEAAANAFDLDPTIVYNGSSLKKQLQLAIANMPAASTGSIRFEDLKDYLSSASLIIYIADDLQKKESDSIFLSRPALNLMRNEILAANFMIKQGLL